MHRRTVLKFAAGAAGTAIVGAAALPVSAQAAGSFVDLAGWPKDARFDAISAGRSGSWAIGMQELHELPDDWRRKAIVRRLHRRTWVPVALPDSFAAWGTAITPDATGAWIVGHRNDVALPEADGSSVVGHLGRDGSWRTVVTTSLPRYAQYASLLLIDGRLELTGYRPTEDGRALLPYCLSRPLSQASAPWIERPIDAPEWSPEMPPPLLKVGSGTTDWATAGAWLLRRSGRGWTVVDSPPGVKGAWHGHCAVAGGSLYLITLSSNRLEPPRLHRRVGRTWTEIVLPPYLALHQFAATKDACWAVGAQHPADMSQPDAATVIRISGSKIVRRLDGPKGLADLACLADGKLLLSGIVPDPAEPDGGWVGHPWLVRS